MIWDFLKKGLKFWHYLQADSLKGIRPAYKPFYFLISLSGKKISFSFFRTQNTNLFNHLKRYSQGTLLRRKETFP